ncbi:MAG TPA: endonuclease/exonuclease/phosphatase family protein [Vicinamibacterales bacterium]
MLRLLTYNIRVGGVNRVAPLARVISACGPDIVLFQEATRPDVIAQLAAQTGMGEWRAYRRQSLAFMSRVPVANARWIKPRLSHHAFIEVVPAGERIRLYGLHLSAVHAAWTERRRRYELKALLRSVARHQHGFHALAGDFNTLAPGAVLDVRRLPLRLRPFVWMSGGRIKWRTIQTVLDADYVDAFRLKHPDEPGLTMPAAAPHVRLDYVFVPAAFKDRIVSCDIVRQPDTSIASDHLPVLAELKT